MLRNVRNLGHVGLDQLVAFLTRPGALLISEGLAGEYGLAVGDMVALDASGQASTGFIAGLLRPEDGLARRALDGMILADIATAQEMAGKLGRLDHIDLILSGVDSRQTLGTPFRACPEPGEGMPG